MMSRAAIAKKTPLRLGFTVVRYACHRDFLCRPKPIDLRLIAWQAPFEHPPRGGGEIYPLSPFKIVASSTISRTKRAPALARLSS